MAGSQIYTFIAEVDFFFLSEREREGGEKRKGRKEEAEGWRERKQKPGAKSSNQASHVSSRNLVA